MVRGLTHHGQQVADQEAVSNHLGIPDVGAICFGEGDFRGSSVVDVIALPGDGTQLIGNAGAKEDRRVEVVDLVVVLIVVGPALPIILHFDIRAAEVINAVFRPTLDKDLGPFHHGVSAECSGCNTGCCKSG